nr:DUF1214 domain-containing protein [Microvirga antarctica]
MLLGLGLGLGSADWVLNGDPPFGGRKLGPWATWPKLGSSDADPYMRAIAARRGDVPLATGEGLTLLAKVDDSGRNLDSACTYRVGSVTPQARLWTMTVYDRTGNLQPSDLGRSGLTSAEIIRRPDDGFDIVVAKALSAGNWLQTGAAGPFTLVLRLYDMPGAAGANLTADDLPRIERLACAP